MKKSKFKDSQIIGYTIGPRRHARHGTGGGDSRLFTHP